MFQLIAPLMSAKLVKFFKLSEIWRLLKTVALDKFLKILWWVSAFQSQMEYARVNGFPREFYALEKILCKLIMTRHESKHPFLRKRELTLVLFIFLKIKSN